MLSIKFSVVESEFGPFEVLVQDVTDLGSSDRSASQKLFVSVIVC